MAGAPEAQPGRRRSLLAPVMVLAVWAPAAAITVAHYATAAEHHWFHDVLRRLYYLPILFAGFSCGLRGGLGAAVAIVVAYSPHAFTSVGHADPAHGLEKALELVLYLVVAAVAGVLVDRERRRHLELAETAARLRLALDERQRTFDQLVRTGRLAALGELVAGIAHEIKNPLHALEGTAEVVDEAVPADAEQRPIWELHVKELARLHRVAERFLSFARPVKPERRPIELARVVERTVALVGAQAREQSVELVVAAPPEGLSPLAADEQQLVQVLLNISLNALQALGEGGTVRYRLRSCERGGQRHQVVEVENDGPPIPEADLERIFDPFSTSKSEGSGLGLSIASRIVEAHDGFIEARNREGGVCFSVFLPE